jgi:hypothetical protein
VAVALVAAAKPVLQATAVAPENLRVQERTEVPRVLFDARMPYPRAAALAIDVTDAHYHDPEGHPPCQELVRRLTKRQGQRLLCDSRFHSTTAATERCLVENPIGRSSMPRMFT